MIKKIMLSAAVLLPALSAWASDLTTDNLTVISNAAIGGKLDICVTLGASATGGTVTTSGGYKIHTFTNNGTFEVSGGSLPCDVLVVAGGGGGGYNVGGGGGGGGVIITNLSVSGSQSVIVGAGGSRGTSGAGGSGSSSSFGSISANGGGGGGDASYAAISGGSGGGGGSAGGVTNGAAGTPGQGYAGGWGRGGLWSGGGGGGASEAGSNAASNVGGAGGDGVASSISGSSYKYGGGGGGSTWSGGTIGIGGTDGGGDGGVLSGVAPEDGDANSGGGGGGGKQHTSGGNGGSGIVIVRYLFSDSSNITSLTVSSNGINQVNSSGNNTFMGKVGIGTNNPAEKLHVAGNVQVDGSLKLGGEARTNWPSGAQGALLASNNLSDVADAAAARSNLGLGSAATNQANAFLTPTSDGSQLTNITAAQVGALSTNAGALIEANNLAEISDTATTARSNLGLGSAATNDAGAFLSINGGEANGAISVLYPGGDIPMGVYTNQ